MLLNKHLGTNYSVKVDVLFFCTTFQYYHVRFVKQRKVKKSLVRLSGVLREKSGKWFPFRAPYGLDWQFAQSNLEVQFTNCGRTLQIAESFIAGAIYFRSTL